ncbi:triphosphoribosyl-dephospho-CoA synthase, partial [Pseudomonas aeruginosa]|nr:triphosphoribosyl-dephospho-CoA synthase [Pseudomonas aeruginosa]
ARRVLHTRDHSVGGDRRLLALTASPGGAADLLAACLFLDRLPAVSGGWAGSL